ncbi:MAG: hypothetical protein K2F87_03845, partial [Muribaculaceae bacterium]|nr:hypothetical protein [Muribaculaceae bacterium]
MKRLLPALLLPLALTSSVQALDVNYDGMAKISVYEGAVFYDGYAMANNPDKDLQDGITRHSCSLYSIPLTDAQLDQIGKTLMMHVD